MNVFEMMNPVPVEDDFVYGYVLDEQQFQQQQYPAQQGYVVTAAVSCDQVEPVSAYDSDEFLEGMIEILAESDNEQNLQFVQSFPVANIESNNTESPFPSETIYPAYSCYAIPEATRVEDHKNFDTDDFDFPVDCVAAFESMDMSDTPAPKSDDQKLAAPNDLFCVGTIDIDYLRNLHDAEEKRERRKEAINRWKLKKLKRKSVIKAVKQSVSTIQEGAAVACNTLMNARQKATAKRERENGKFKKTKVQWVSVTDLFNSTFDDFK